MRTNYDHCNGKLKGNPCPVCGRQRSIHDFSHGECMKEMARREKENEKKIHHKFEHGQVTEGQYKKSKEKQKKKRYLDGKLPDWMYE